MEETWTILKVIQWTTDYFRRRGIDQPRSNAEVLLAHVLGTARLKLYLHHDQPLTPQELALYRDIIRRRAAFEPTQYITGRQEFWSLEFEVTSSVLIPRPETELLVEKAVEFLDGRPGRLLDLGTGSGAVAVSIARECPGVSIVASDASIEALAVARRNAVRHGTEDRIFFVASDLFSAFTPSKPPFDLVVSNPPYIGDVEFAVLAPEVRRYEPEAALRGGGQDGLDIIRRILDEVHLYLKPGGPLLVEIGFGQAEILEAELSGYSRIESRGFTKDYSGIPRVLHCSIRR